MSGTIVQIAVSAPDAGPAVFGATTTPGNLIAVVLTCRGGSPPRPRMSTGTGTWTVFADGEAKSDGDGAAAVGQIVGTGATSYASAGGTDHGAILAIEIAGSGLSDVSVLSKADQAFSTDANIGSFAAVGTNDILLMALAYRMNGTFSISGAAYGWTTDAQLGAIGGADHPWSWVGHRTGSGATVQARATESGGAGSDSQTWGGVALRIRGAYPITPGVFMDWDGDGFQAGAHDDVTADAMEWSITRGAGAEITGGSTPGACVLTLKNPSDIYNPNNAASPIHTQLNQLNIPVWIGVTDDGKVSGATANGLFGGRVTDITVIPSPGAGVPATVEFLCEDAIGWYNRLPVQLDYAEGRSHAALRLAALIAAGETRYDLDHEIQTMPLSHADGYLGPVLDQINSVTGTRHLAKPADLYTDWYKYTTHNRQYGLSGTATAALDFGADHVTETDGWRLAADTVNNQQKATLTPIVFTPASFTVWQADVLPIQITVDHPYSVVVSFDDVVSGSLLNLASTGAAVIQSYTPFATGGKISLTVASGTAVVSHLTIEGSLARRLEQQSYVSDDLTSQGVNARGVRAGGEISNEYLGVLAEARGITDHVVWRYGNPQFRPSATVINWFPEMFQLDLGDTIAATSTHLSEAGRIFEIVGLTLHGQIAASTVQLHTMQLTLQESRVQDPADFPWFTLDTSELAAAGTDVLGY